MLLEIPQVRGPPNYDSRFLILTKVYIKVFGEEFAVAC